MTQASAYLFPHKNDNGELVLSLLSAPVVQTYPDEPNPQTMVGLLNSDACLRTASLDNDGILQGDVRFTILDYSTTSAPNRFRYLSSNLSRSHQAKLMECMIRNRQIAKEKNVEIKLYIVVFLPGASLRKQRPQLELGYGPRVVRIRLLSSPSRPSILCP